MPKNQNTDKTLDFGTHATIGSANLMLAFAQNVEEQTKGLSFQAKINPNEGLFFVFNSPDRYGIWMKDMNFAIDVIWLDENMKVVFIKENFTPQSFPEIVTPPTPAKFVLETQSGFASTNKIKVGTVLKIDKNTP